MRVWYDAGTGKQVRYAAAIGKRLRKKYKYIFTTREHPDTVALARLIGEEPLVVGSYNPASLNTRLKESAERILDFLEMFKDNLPDAAVAHQSVELCSTAFGLGIPIILTADTPYAYAVNRLTIPLAHTLVVSEALPRGFAKSFCARNVVTFRGVDEVAWIKGLKPTPIEGLKRPFIVVRQMETKAAYAANKADVSDALLQKLSKLGSVHYLNRYNPNGQSYRIKPVFEDSVNLVANADLVVNYGGTIAREAALLGVPSIAISDMAKTYVNRYVAKKGFPLFITNEDRVFEYAKKYIGKRFDVHDKLDALENPVDLIEGLVERVTKK